MDWSHLPRFCQQDPQNPRSQELRLRFLVEALATGGVPHRLLSIQGCTHIFVPGVLPQEGSPWRPRILVAHYDRVPGTPGANDNSASVFHLLLWLRDHYGRTDPQQPWAVVFTDGEEIGGGRRSDQQGSRALGEFFLKTPWADSLFVVFDMTGIGDTPILGRGVETQLQQFFSRGVPGPLLQRVEEGRLWARRVLAQVGGGGFVELPTPFSDDLGLLLAGIPAIQITLLPRKQALQAKANGLDRSHLPPAWAMLHTPQDIPEGLDPGSRPLIGQLISSLIQYPLRR